MDSGSSLKDHGAGVTGRSLAQEEVLEGELRVVYLFCVVAMTNAVTRHVQRLSHGIEVKSNDSWCQPYRRYTTFRSKPPDSRLADLQKLGQLFSCEKLFPLFHALRLRR